VECDLTPMHCSGEAMIATVRAPTMRISGRNIRMTQGVLRIQEAETIKAAWAAHGTLSVSGVSPEPTAWWPSMSDWAIKFSADQGGIKADLRVDTPTHEGFVTARIEQPLQAAQGIMHGVIGPLTFNGTDRRLSKMIMGLPPSTDLIDGVFTSTVDASWSSNFRDRTNVMKVVSATAKVVADKLSGHYYDSIVKGLSTTMVVQAQGLESFAMTQPASIFIAAVQSGVDFANLTASYQMRWKLADALPTVDIRDFRCEVFGGTISNPGSVLDLAKPPVTT